MSDCPSTEPITSSVASKINAFAPSEHGIVIDFVSSAGVMVPVSTRSFLAVPKMPKIDDPTTMFSGCKFGSGSVIVLALPSAVDSSSNDTPVPAMPLLSTSTMLSHTTNVPVCLFPAASMYSFPDTT